MNLKLELPKLKLPETDEVKRLRQRLAEKEHRKSKKLNRKYQEDGNYELVKESSNKSGR